MLELLGSSFCISLLKTAVKSISKKFYETQLVYSEREFFFSPTRSVGWAIFMAAIAYTIYLFIDIDSRSHSVSDTLINWEFNCLILAVGYSLIGFFTEKKNE